MSNGQELSPRLRLVACVLLGVLSGHYARFAAVTRPIHPDFGQVWFAARAIIHGQNPYALIGPGLEYEWAAPLFYPLPAALVAIPFAAFPLPDATALFVAVGATAFAWALTKQGAGPLFAFTSICFHQAAHIAQWSPMLAGATVIIPLSLVLIAKPTIGLAVFAAHPSRWGIGAASFLTAASFVVQPHWFHAWRVALMAASVGAGKAFPYSPPIMFPGGALVLLALLRWRRPEARLLAVLACVPQTMLPYEGVLLFLVPRGWRQSLALSVLSWSMIYFVRTVIRPVGLTETVTSYGPAMTLFLYLPATLMVVRRANEGHLPTWIEARIENWPVWFVGTPARADGLRKQRLKRLP